jgi:low temperature requirement protein LtrA
VVARAKRDDSAVSARPERSVRVSTLELFFDLVFVFTITRLTGVLVPGEGGAAGLAVDAGLVLVALLALGLSAALWWVYFSDQEAVERAFRDTPPGRRPQLALTGFGYWHYGILLGIVAVAAGLRKAIGDPYGPLNGETARRGP